MKFVYALRTLSNSTQLHKLRPIPKKINHQSNLSFDQFLEILDVLTPVNICCIYSVFTKCWLLRGLMYHLAWMGCHQLSETIVCQNYQNRLPIVCHNLHNLPTDSQQSQPDSFGQVVSNKASYSLISFPSKKEPKVFFRFCPMKLGQNQKRIFVLL